MTGTYGTFTGGYRRFIVLAALAVATAPACGCVTLPSLCHHETAPVGMPCQLATRWDNGVRETCDTVNGGAPLRGLSGRLYLVDNEYKTVCDDASAIVDLYDDRPLAAGGQPVHLEQWVFPPEVLQMLLRKDAVGWGYTLFLPWMNSYRPDITQVHVRICHKASNGVPMYTVSSTINLADPNAPNPQALAKAGAAQVPVARPGAWVPAAPPAQPVAQTALQPVARAPAQPAVQPAQAVAQSAYPADMPPPIQMQPRRAAPPVVQASAQIAVTSAGQQPAPAEATPAAPANEASWAGRAK